MEIGRNLEKDEDRQIYSVVFRWQNEKTIRRWNFNTERKATIKFNKMKKASDWLPIQEDVTI